MYAWKLDVGNQEVPVLPAASRKEAGRMGNSQGHAPHVRRREVGLLRSTSEGSEQSPQGERRDWREGGGSRRTQ
jgi:hypothetical protein